MHATATPVGDDGETSAVRSWAQYAREIGLAVQRRRLQLGLTQIEAAARANVVRSFYQQIELGRLSNGEAANPSIWVLVSLAQALETRVDELLPAGWTIDPAERRAPEPRRRRALPSAES